jgi:diketogulonate reductase-like aldo/keto reductase
MSFILCRNERDVGVGIKKSGVPRSDVFVVTKLWMDDHGYDRCKASFNESLKK